MPEWSPPGLREGEEERQYGREREKESDEGI